MKSVPMNLNPRPAPLEFALAVKRRLQKSHPGAELSTDSVKLVALPGAPYDATVFTFALRDAKAPSGHKLVMVAELCKPDLPHIYQAATVDPKDKKQNAIALLKLIGGLANTVRTDRRFQRNIITLNGSHNGSSIIVPKGLRI